MRIAIGCDHNGLELKEALVPVLEADGHDVLDLGTFSPEPVDYPDFARSVGQAVMRGFVEAGVLVCGSGVGASIAANKLRGVRAALCHDLFTARQSREDDDANLLCLGARAFSVETAIAVTRAWLGARFSGEEPHVRRVAKIAQLEPGGETAAKPVGRATLGGAVPGVASRAPAAPPGSEPSSPRPPVPVSPPSEGADLRPPAPGRPVAPVARPTPPRTVEPPAVPARPAPPPQPDKSLAELASELIRQVAGDVGDDSGGAKPEGVISLEGEADELVVLSMEPPPPRRSPESRGPATRPPETKRPEARTPPATPPVEAKPAPPAPEPRQDPLRLPVVEEALGALEAQDYVDRLWVKDGTIWKGDPAANRNRLGWLTSPTIMREHADDIKAFADETRRLNFSQVVLLGMGGSSLCPEVLGATFGSKMGFPDLLVLDSTDPAAVKQTLARINLNRTLFLVSTKSGTTTETLSLYSHFHAQVSEQRLAKPGVQFVAITDRGSPLESLATEAGFRRTFLNPPSIGGRYSALSFFGLVPGALIGVDIKALLERAQRIVEACGPEVGLRDSPAVRLGAALAAFAKEGRDKVTFIFSNEIAALGAWIEQLIAESLGKDGIGIVPVDGEALGAPGAYGADRVFVAMTLESDRTHDKALTALSEAGHPVIQLGLKDKLDLGAEFFRWELATASAGAVLGVNPFDEPDVARAKSKTAELLEVVRKKRPLPEWPVACEQDGIALMTNAAPRPTSLADGIGAHLALARPGDYLAVQAYLTPHPETWSRLQELRMLCRDRLRIATTMAYGPRYLHSTGQLHKGGPATGLFIQLTGEDRDDLPIPGAGHGFSTLKAAQALGDLAALAEAGRRVIRLRLAGKQAPALERLVEVVRAATRKR